MAFSEYASYDGLGLAELVKKGEVSSSELAEEAISRIEKHNPTINAVILKLYDLGREMAKAPADGPFMGVPFLLKDAFGDIAGYPTRLGSRFKSGAPVKEDSALAKRFRASGLAFLGKTNVPEFTLLPTTESALYGPARNPWNVEHSTGGSSGGAGAAVAAGIVPLAHANDSGGSIRIPASSCGLVGLKPTRGRSPFGPHYGDVLSGLCHEHVVTRTVRDSAAMLDCIHGNEPGDPYVAPPVERPFLEETKQKPGKLRVAFSRTNPAGAALHPDCVKGVEEVAKCLADLGHDVSEAMPPLKADEPGNIFLPMWGAWLASEIEGEAARIGRGPQQGDLEPLTMGLYEVGKQVSSAQYLMLVKEMHGLARRVAGFMQDYDVWLTPTLALPPIPLGLININEPDPIAAFAPAVDYVPFTPIQNLTGQPALSLPLSMSAEGLPIGMMFSARYGDEATLFRLAAQLEEAMPWKDRHPAVWN
jgi:amidase